MRLLLIVKHKWASPPYLRVEPKPEFVLCVEFDKGESNELGMSYENFKTTRTPRWLRQNKTMMQCAEVAAIEANEIVSKLSVITDAGQYKDGEVIWSQELPQVFNCPR